MKCCFLMVLILSLKGTYGQATGHSLFDAYVHSGYNNHSYTQNHPGWYLSFGADVKLWKNLKLGILVGYSRSDNFPKRLKVFSFQQEDEDAILQSFIGISQKEWIEDAKGIYRSIQAPRIGINASYEFLIKEKFSISPMVGINLLTVTDVSLGVFEASFVNGRLVDGKVGYDFRKGNLAGASFGLRIGYTINNGISLFISAEDIRDINGDAFIYYETKNLGAGLMFSFRARRTSGRDVKRAIGMIGNYRN